MSNRRFEMYEYLVIISQLRQGASVRGLARSQVADRKKLRKVRDVALAQGWLDANKEMPGEEELSLFFKKSRSDSSAYLAQSYGSCFLGPLCMKAPHTLNHIYTIGI